MKILVVDDEEELLELYEDFLNMEGYEVHTNKNADDAISSISNNTYSLVISDYNMGAKSGIDVLNHLHSTHPATPFFLISGQSLDEKVEFMSQQSKLLLKPVDMDELIGLISQIGD